MLSKRTWVQGHTQRDTSQHREGDNATYSAGVKMPLFTTHLDEGP